MEEEDYENEDEWDTNDGWQGSEDEDDLDPFVLDCGDPECLMPGPHYLSECHTAEMIEAYQEEEQKERERMSREHEESKQETTPVSKEFSPVELAIIEKYASLSIQLEGYQRQVSSARAYLRERQEDAYIVSGERRGLALTYWELIGSRKRENLADLYERWKKAQETDFDRELAAITSSDVTV